MSSVIRRLVLDVSLAIRKVTPSLLPAPAFKTSPLQVSVVLYVQKISKSSHLSTTGATAATHNLVVNKILLQP